MIKDETKWYASWFDTKYYHILYKDRGYEEAEDFMRNLTAFLQLKKEASSTHSFFFVLASTK